MLAASPFPGQPPGPRDPQPLVAMPSVRPRARAGGPREHVCVSVSLRSFIALVPGGWHRIRGKIRTWEPWGLDSYFWSPPCSGGVTFGTFLSPCLSFL